MKETNIEVPIEGVLQFFAKEFEVPDGEKIIKRNWYLDPIKGKVLFVLTIKTENEE